MKNIEPENIEAPEDKIRREKISKNIGKKVSERENSHEDPLVEQQYEKDKKRMSLRNKLRILFYVGFAVILVTATTYYIKQYVDKKIQGSGLEQLQADIDTYHEKVKKINEINANISKLQGEREREQAEAIKTLESAYYLCEHYKVNGQAIESCEDIKESLARIRAYQEKEKNENNDKLTLGIVSNAQASEPVETDSRIGGVQCGTFVNDYNLLDNGKRKYNSAYEDKARNIKRTNPLNEDVFVMKVASTLDGIESANNRIGHVGFTFKLANDCVLLLDTNRCGREKLGIRKVCKDHKGNYLDTVTCNGKYSYGLITGFGDGRFNWERNPEISKQLKEKLGDAYDSAKYDKKSKIKNYVRKYPGHTIPDDNDFFEWAFDVTEAANIKLAVPWCIAMSDSGLGKTLATAYNYGNVGNTSTSRNGFNNAKDGFQAILKTLNNNALSQWNTIGELSCGGREKLGWESCGKSFYASSPVNWNKNVITCLKKFEGEVNESWKFRK